MIQHWLSFFLLIVWVSLHGSGLQDPKSYAKHSHLQWEWAMQALERYHWQGDEKVLDIGCGDGKISAFLAQKCTQGDVLGIDISPAMIQFARSLFAKDMNPNLDFCIEDIATLPFDEEFDLIVSFCSFHYVLEPEKGFLSVWRSLKPGGRFLCMIPGKNRSNLIPVSERLIQGEKWAPYFSSFQRQRVYLTEEECIEQIHRAGLELVYFSVKKDPVVFASQTALIDWIRPIVNYISHLSQELQEDFLKDLSNMMSESAIIGPHGTITLESILFEYLCQKLKDF